jgi:DNA-binding transcriptional MerR regulator
MKYVVDNLLVTANTLRFYEKEGIIKDISRDSNGRRIYSDENIKWVTFIRSLRLTGMSISKIKEYVELYELGDATFFQRKEMMMKHRSVVQSSINESLKHLEIISYKIAMYDLQEQEAPQKI